MSLRLGFSLMIGFISLLAIAIVGVGSYTYSKKEAIVVAKEKGSIIFNFLQASRNHFQTKEKPEIEALLKNSTNTERDIPAHLISGFALTRGVWEKFTEKNSDYDFKQATVDPLVLSNKADSSDLDIIASFKNNSQLTTIEGTKIRNGQSYYYFSQKIAVEKGCLRCHGEPQSAPEWQKRQYGTENGYNWKEGDIVSAYIVYVPIQKALDKAKKNTLIIFSTGVVLVLMMMMVVSIYFTSKIINPIVKLEKCTTNISLGRNMDVPLMYQSDNEIGKLYTAMDRLRISVVKMLSRFNK